MISQQSCNDSVEEVKGKDGDRPVWHLILVSCDKLAAFKEKKKDAWIQISDFGYNILYRDKAGAIRQASGYGTGPPAGLLKWINENYGK